MHAIKDPLGELRPVALARLEELETILVAHGFTAEVQAKFWAVTAHAAADTRGPRRSRRVQLAADLADDLHWYWRPRGVEGIEQIGPAGAVGGVVEIIARALDKTAER